VHWLKRLVENETELLRTGSGDFISHQDHRKVVEEATLEFMRELKEEFLNCVDLFNSYRGGSHLPNSVKIFNISNTQADFILFRNTMKLVVSNPALGVINFSFVNRASTFTRRRSNPRRKATTSSPSFTPSTTWLGRSTGSG
jgi:hypothetical protein